MRSLSNYLIVLYLTVLFLDHVNSRYLKPESETTDQRRTAVLHTVEIFKVSL